MDESTRVEQSKFAVDDVPLPIDGGDLPWAYGENRVTVLIRDPDSAFLYWELTDEGIAAARSRLGPAGKYGWCNLRIYDTTGRQFDGTNANDYFDIKVERLDREYFVMIRRPTSTIHVEIGIRSHEGFFQAIARSGGGVFPRSGPSPNATLEWLTVTSSDAPPCVSPYRSRYKGPPPELPGRSGAGYVDVWRAGYAPSHPAMESTHRPGVATSGQWTSSSAHRTFERHRSAHIERWWRLDEWRAEWRAGLRFFRWEHFDPQRIVVELLDDTPEHLYFEGGEMVASGPWRVTVRSFERGGGEHVLSTWSMRWLRALTPMIERWETALEYEIVSGYERGLVVEGASERYQLLERGASEVWRLGGSERLWLGASEWAMAGGSATVRLGASEGMGESVRLGASAFGGASEGLSRGAGELWAQR